ncbi:gem-associated protein 4 [Alligator mississippiensis]|uniref:gem-associated protein 4 n=1 Tax=Alligator mississippiensis TaxID=8496 RepID=UPI002877D529|nr:gem-associated protein 4 [Alligator mississippiensis]
MEPGPVNICEETAVLHGGFLLAAKRYHPKALADLAKADWHHVGPPITDALKEICAGRTTSLPQPRSWKKKAVMIIWAKILLPSPGPAKVDQRWKDDAFFSVCSMIPRLNRTVLFELLKALNAPRLFVQLLLALPAGICQQELELLVEYVVNETTPSDLRFFLDVWWEIMKHKEGQQDQMIVTFSALIHQHLSEPLDEGCQPPKRFKGDPLSMRDSPLTTELLTVLVDGLKHLYGCIVTPRMKCYALANLVDLLSVFTVVEQESSVLPTVEYLDKITSVVILWNGDCESRYHPRGLEEKVKEAERSVSLLSVVKLSSEELFVGLRFFHNLLQGWSEELHCMLNSRQEVCYEGYRLLDSLATFGKNLLCFAEARELSKDEKQVVLELAEIIMGFLKQINPDLQGKDSDSSIMASVAMTIIEQKMDRHLEMCSIFASEKAWAFSRDWVTCLIKNKVLFQKPDLVLKLLETTVTFSLSSSNRESQELQVKVTKTILECYTELSLPDKNKVISGVLDSWGGRGLSLSLKAFTEGFQEELNLAFNQITRSASDQGLTKAVASVARLALLHPEATVKKVCNLAVVNLGTHQFLAQILCSFPALSFQEAQEGLDRGGSLLVRCLKETVWGKLSTAKEKEQFLEFLAVLLQPGSASPLLSPGEVTQAFVLPYLKSDCAHIELSLHILNKVLGLQSGQDEHWIKTCHPFPLLLGLCKLLDSYTHYWHRVKDQPCPALETKDLVAATLAQLCEVVEQKAAPSLEVWNQSLAWLHRRVEPLDWTVGLRLKKLYGSHFKNEVPATLFEICKLSEDEWTPRPLPAYGPGSGLLVWIECCCISAALREQMLVLLAINVDNPEEVNLFSKGFLVALVQILPWCTHGEWKRLAHVIQTLLQRQVLHVPYSLEYVQYMPLLNLKPFAHPLQFSVLLLRGFQFLCSSSCSTWLLEEAWQHMVRLYCASLTDLLGTVKGALPSPCPTAEDKDLTQEASFVYIQLFCHVLHVVAMLPDNGCSEPLGVLALETVSQYDALCAIDRSLNSSLRRANEKYFLASITDSVSHQELRAALQQKLSKL